MKLKHTVPSFVLGTSATLSLAWLRRVVTWNISPAPSQSEHVMRGVWMYMYPLFYESREKRPQKKLMDVGYFFYVLGSTNE